MRAALLAVLMISSHAHGQELYCPARYPAEDVVFNQVPTDMGKISAGNLLSGGGMFNGDPKDNVELQGMQKKAANGYDVLFRFPGNEQKWLACGYGSVSLFRRVSDKAKECKLQARGKAGGVGVKLTCR